MNSATISAIEWGTLVGQRPRQAGCNSRGPVHGNEVRVPLARITTSDGTTGFGACGRLTQQEANAFLGERVDDLIHSANGVAPRAASLEFPLWDLLGRRTGRPVYQLLAESAGKDRFRAPARSLLRHLPLHRRPAPRHRRRGRRPHRLRSPLWLRERPPLLQKSRSVAAPATCPSSKATAAM